MNTKEIAEMAKKAGACKFYPEHQLVGEQNYVVSAGFLERFAADVVQKERERTYFYESLVDIVCKAHLDPAGEGGEMWYAEVMGTAMGEVVSALNERKLVDPS